jgi:hypothetical protein
MLDSINDIWSWLSMGLFGGMAVPFILRWYWHRFNGWGYAIGTIVGIGAAILQKLVWPDLDEASQLGVISVIALGACVVGTYVTAPTEPKILGEFYRKTRPFGLWGCVRRDLSDEERHAIRAEHIRDLVSILPAVCLFFFLFLGSMYAVLGDWNMTGIAFAVVVVCGAILYFTWYRHLGEAHDE